MNGTGLLSTTPSCKQLWLLCLHDNQTTPHEEEWLRPGIDPMFLRRDLVPFNHSSRRRMVSTAMVDVRDLAPLLSTTPHEEEWFRRQLSIK